MATVPIARSLARLAAHGGPPVCNRPLPSWPHFDDKDIAAATVVLASGHANYWTGDEGSKFESEFAQWVGAPHAVAVSNGTTALEIALRALGIGPGDDVVVPSATFIATASAVATCGARPVVADVDLDSQSLTPETVLAVLTPRTAAVIVVHVAGYPADVAALHEVAKARRLRLVEDCAQAHGARRDGRGVGTFGDVAAWSFCNDKIMTTAGEGGAITTADTALWRRCWELKDHGKSYEAVFERDHPGGFRWLHDTFGTNARMSEVQAAVGRSQLQKLSGWVATRQAHSSYLRGALSGVPALRLPNLPLGVEHSYYRFYAYVRPEMLKPDWDRDRIVAAINAEGVSCLHGGCTEIYREKAFARVAGAPTRLPVAARLGATSLTLPIHPRLSVEDTADIGVAVRKVFQEATS